MPTQSNSIPGHGYTVPGTTTASTYIDSLVWGCAWVGVSPGTPITYYFGSGAVNAGHAAFDSLPTFTGAAWTQTQKDAFTTALAQYSAVCNLSFQEASTQGAANIVWWLAPQSAMGAGSLGLHDVPDGSTAQLYGYFNYQDPTWNYLSPGGDGFVTVIHELGHGMGLAHPHDGGDHADATRFPGVRSAFSTGSSGLNQGIWTTMSYNDGWNQAPATSYAYGYQGSLMALDVAALQAIYGANTSTRTGNDTYALPSVNAAGTYWQCLWDAGGSDTITNAGSSLACTINLNAAPLVGANAGGYVSRDLGIIGGYTIANGVTIENATGGSGNDVLVGNAADNTLDGGAGADAMSGGKGNDTYIVDNVSDSVTEQSGEGTDTVLASVSWTLSGNVENLVLTGSAALSGTGNALDNQITGNAGNNTLNGGNGNDVLIGGAGADRLTGGRGADVFKFIQASDSPVGLSLHDVITDFNPSQGDRIDLSQIDANSVAGGDQAFAYIGAAVFSGSPGELRFSAGLLAGDINGDGVADFEVQITGVSSLGPASLVA